MIHSNDPGQSPPPWYQPRPYGPYTDPARQPYWTYELYRQQRALQRRAIRRESNTLYAYIFLALAAGATAAVLFAAPLYLADEINGTRRAAIELNYGWGVVLTRVLPFLLSEVVLLMLSYFLLDAGIRCKTSRRLKTRDGIGLTAFGTFACIGGGLAALLITVLLSMPFSYLGLQPNASQWDIPTQTGPRLAVLAFTFIISPLLQEMIFRGLILNNLRRYGERFAIIFSALLCAFYPIQPGEFLRMFVFGLILGYIAVRTGNIYMVITARVLAEFLFGFSIWTIRAVDSAVFFISYLILTYVIAIAFTIHNSGKIHRETSPMLKTRQRVGAALSGVGAVIGIIAYLAINFSRLLFNS